MKTKTISVLAVTFILVFSLLYSKEEVRKNTNNGTNKKVKTEIPSNISIFFVKLVFII